MATGAAAVEKKRYQKPFPDPAYLSEVTRLPLTALVRFTSGFLRLPTSSRHIKVFLRQR